MYLCSTYYWMRWIKMRVVEQFVTVPTLAETLAVASLAWELEAREGVTNIYTR